MSAPLSNNNLHLSSALNISEEAMVSKKQGIVSILAGSDGDDQIRPLNKAASSLRRALSADMSSKKWLSQHPLKKIASSERFPAVDSEEGQEDYEERKESEAMSQSDEKKQKEKEESKSGPFDIWSSIISHKALDKSSLPPPYIHPLLKTSASSLSKKSLEICTESLGSETGSDGFSSSENSDVEEEQEQEIRVPAQASSFEEEPRIVKYNYDFGKKSTLQFRSFPPPIPSLSNREGASVRMKAHRDNGRLVVEAVSQPSQNNFLAQRKDGRLLLTFANHSETESMDEDKDEAMNVEEEEEQVKGLEELEEEEFESFEEESEEEIEIEIEGVKVKERWYEMEAPKLSSGLMNVHRLAVMMNKPIWLANRNSTWPKNFDQIVKLGDEKEINPTTQPPPPPPLGQSLPPRPPPSTTAAASSFNSYDCWRPNQSMSKSGILDQLAPVTPPKDNKLQQQLILSKNQMANNDQQKLLVLRGNKVDYFVPLLKGCKEHRRSLLFWEPYCVATS